MSEKLLKAIIRLLVIVAKEEGKVDEVERESVKQFLYQNISREDTKHYLKILDRYISEINIGIGKDDEANIEKITPR
ncbi:MAG: hypothetical protein OXH57_03185, partial [Ekhidna sp.]|nr:hypothetical protein [Ekhidna sp.]